MALFRKIHVTFWSDPFTDSLDHKSKLFYIYLMTNERTTQCGIYSISVKKIAFDLGFTVDEVVKMVKEFEAADKIKYSQKTNEVAIKNWVKHNSSKSPKVLACVEKELKEVKNRVLIQYLYSIDTVSQQEQEEEQEEEQRINRDIPTLKEFLEYGRYRKKNVDLEDLTLKYEAWKANGWKDGNDKPIKNWQSKLINTLRYIKEDNSKKNNNPVLNRSDFFTD